MRSGLLALCAVFGVSCSEAPARAPVLPFDTSPQCPEGDATCVNAGVTSFEVEGVRVLHRRVEGHPLVAMQLYFDELSAPSGAQYWAEQLALDLLETRGPRRLQYPAWSNKLAELGASVSTWNARSFRGIEALAPRPRWRALWSLLMEALHDPQYASYQLDHQRAVYEAGFVRSRDEPESAAGQEAWARLTRGERGNLAWESREALAAVAPGDLDEAWRSLLTKQRLLVILIGDLTEQAARDAVQEGLASIAERHLPDFVDTESELEPDGHEAVLVYPASATWYFRSYFMGPPPDAPEYAALRLGVQVLSQRLFDGIRDVRGLAYTTGASTQFGMQTYAGVWLSTAAPGEALPVLRAILTDLRLQGPTPEELEAARSTIRVGTLQSFDTPDGLGRLLAEWELSVGDRRALEAHYEYLEAASPDDVRGALDTYLRSGATAAAGPSEEVTEADLRALYE